MKQTSTWLAPAKLNLFLYVTGKREDGYHFIETLFNFINIYDVLQFNLRDDGIIENYCQHPLIEKENNLAIKAAKLLKVYTYHKGGVDVYLRKKIPIGAGLGGGSSDAATTLLALNKLWDLNLPRDELLELSVHLGADVPVFVSGNNSYAQGIGEQLLPIKLPESHYIVVIPPIFVSTGQIFSNIKLTSRNKPCKIRDVLAIKRENQLQDVTCKLYPEVLNVINWLSQHGKPLMSGSGSAVYLEVDNVVKAQTIVKSCPENWKAVYARGLVKHPHL